MGVGRPRGHSPQRAEGIRSRRRPRTDRRPVSSALSRRTHGMRRRTHPLRHPTGLRHLTALRHPTGSRHLRVLPSSPSRAHATTVGSRAKGRPARQRSRPWSHADPVGRAARRGCRWEPPETRLRCSPRSRNPRSGGGSSGAWAQAQPWGDRRAKLSLGGSSYGGILRFGVRRYEQQNFTLRALGKPCTAPAKVTCREPAKGVRAGPVRRR